MPSRIWRGSARLRQRGKNFGLRNRGPQVLIFPITIEQVGCFIERGVAVIHKVKHRVERRILFTGPPRSGSEIKQQAAPGMDKPDLILTAGSIGS